MSQGEIFQETDTLRIQPKKKGPHVVTDTLNQSFPSFVSLVSLTEHITQNTEVEAREIDVFCVYWLFGSFSPTISTELTIFPQSTVGVEFKIVLSVMYEWLMHNHSCYC